MFLFLLEPHVATVKISLALQCSLRPENCQVPGHILKDFFVSSERAENEAMLELNHKSIGFFPLLLTVPRNSSLIFHCYFWGGEAQNVSQIINQSISLSRIGQMPNNLFPRKCFCPCFRDFKRIQYSTKSSTNRLLPNYHPTQRYTKSSA